MNKNKLRNQCQIQKEIVVFCLACAKPLQIPMHQAVNGESIICTHCGHQFIFREEESSS